MNAGKDYSLLEAEERDGTNRLAPVGIELEEQVRYDFIKI